MSTLSLRLPSSLHRQLRELAKREGVSINQIVNAAVGEKVASLMTLDYLRVRAARGSRAEFEAVLAKVADVPPADIDRLPNNTSHRTRRRLGRR
jgi:hypothetical protein